MKNFYQQKKGGWRLEPVIYAKTLKQIRCYRYFQRMLLEGSCPPSSLDNLRRYMSAVEQSLTSYVPEAYRLAVFAHLVDDMDYHFIEEHFFVSIPTLKRYTQVFIWGVAECLGENY